jgi:hypothetical protein
LSFEDEDGESIIQILNGTPLLKNLHLYPCIDDEHNPSRLFQRLSDPSSTDNASKFLPRLETMSYIGLLNFPWGLIPKIFGPTWRPLSNFRFHFYGLSEEDPEEAYIDETTLSQIWELQRRGISIEIRHTSLGTDFLEISRRWLSERLDL